MTQEQLMKVKIKYLEDRIDTLERSIGRINVIMHKFQIKENLDKEKGFKDIGELSQGFCLKSKDNDNEMI